MPSLVEPIVPPGTMHALEQPTLDSGRVRLRAWRQADAPAVVAAHADPAIQRWHLRSLHEESEARDWIEGWAEAWSTERGASWAVLVWALAAAGRTAEADATVQRFRSRLADELGLDASPALAEVHTALLRGELSPSPASPSPAASVSGPHRRPPLPRSSFRGRRHVLDELGSTVASQRCVTVVGPGGVGKTRLALELAHREGRDVVWTDLLDARTRHDVLGRIALATGTASPSDVDTLWPLAAELTARASLVVLDNCEQAVGEVAAVVDALLAATSATTVLATSRTPLAVHGEHVVHLAPLPTTSSDGRASPALELFGDRVGRSVDLEEPSGHRAATDIVVALDGLPLALELAAKQSRNLGLRAVRDRLDQRLELLATDRGADHPAHSDLRSLVRWSTDQLDELDQRSFRWLAVFSGSFTLAQAEQLLGPSGAMVPTPAASVGRLVEQSLLERRRPDRFLLLETLRVCGVEELQARGEGAAARAQHVELVIATAEAAAAGFGTSNELEGIEALGELVADLQAVTDRLTEDRDVEGLCRLACGLRRYADFTQHLGLLRCAATARQLLDEGLGANVAVDLRHGARVAAAFAAAAQGDLEQARRQVESVLADEPSEAVGAAAWNALGDLMLWQADPGAEAAYAEAVRASEAADDPPLAIAGRVGIVLSRAYRGDVEGSREAAAELEARAEGLGGTLIAAWTAYARGEAEAEHDPATALDAFDRALRLARTVRAHLIVAAAGAAAVRARLGDSATVLRDIRGTLRQLRGSGDSPMRQYVLRSVAVQLTRLGSDDTAAVLLGATASDALYEAERRRVEVATEALVERLGAEVVVQRRADGARMAPQDVVDVALRAVEELLEP